MSECIFSDETYSSTAIWILSLHSVPINLFFGTDLLFFCFRLFYLSTRFLRFLSFESFFTFHLISDFPFIILFEMLWMLFMVNKVKHMVCHGSHMSQVTDELFLTHFFFSVSNEITPALVTCVLTNNFKKVSKNFHCSIYKHWREGEKEKQYRQLQSFLPYMQTQ